MGKVAETREYIERDSFSIGSFIKSLADKGKVSASLVEVDKSFVRETEGERIIRIKKGVTLTPCAIELFRGNTYVLDVPESDGRYLYSTNSHGGMLDDDGNQTIYYHIGVRKFSKNFDLTRVRKAMYDSGLIFPEGVIRGEVNINHTNDDVSGTSSSLGRKGEMDGFLEKICEFARARG